MRGNRLGAEGATHVAEALKVNKTLLSVEYAPLPISTVSSR